jgi:hypothetical protein
VAALKAALIEADAKRYTELTTERVKSEAQCSQIEKLDSDNKALRSELDAMKAHSTATQQQQQQQQQRAPMNTTPANQ